jgi:hypothetical protein
MSFLVLSVLPVLVLVLAEHKLILHPFKVFKENLKLMQSKMSFRT